MTTEEKPKQKDIEEVLTEFVKKVKEFSRQMEKVNLPYVKLANDHLAETVEQTIEDIKEYRVLLAKQQVSRK